jgi:hypothetical protein
VAKRTGECDPLAGWTSRAVRRIHRVARNDPLRAGALSGITVGGSQPVRDMAAFWRPDLLVRVHARGRGRPRAWPFASSRFVLRMSLGRGEERADVVLRSADHVPEGCDIEAFRRGIIELVQANHRRTAERFSLAPFATRLFDLQRRSGIAAAPEFIFPLVSLLVLEGMINEFDAQADFQAEAIPTLLTALRAA